MKRICLFLFIFFTCATISYADLTSLSKKASQLKMGMSLKSVIALLGEPDWLILSSDTGSYKDAVPPNLYQVMWSNNDCVPVAVHFDISNSKATGWDEGKWLCGSSAKPFTPSPQYSLDQKNRREFLNSKLGFQGNEIVLSSAEISNSLDEEPVIGWDGKPVPRRVTKSKPEEIPSLPGAMEKPGKVYVLYEIDIYSESKFEGELITRANSGTVLTALKKEGDWIIIRTLNEKIGWVHKDWVVGTEKIIKDLEAKAELTLVSDIKELEAKIRKIPASKIEENLLGYQQLLQLDPLNKKYKQKVIYYESKLSKENKKSTLDMINSPLEQLNAELTGKTERQITAIVGRPAKTVELGNNMYMWVYGNTNTSKDRCILFQNGKASGVSFW